MKTEVFLRNHQVSLTQIGFKVITDPSNNAGGTGALCAVALRFGVSDLLHTCCRSVGSAGEKGKLLHMAVRMGRVPQNCGKYASFRALTNIAVA